MVDAVSTLPSAPSRSQAPATFNTDADAFMAALISMVTELNTSISQMNLEFSGTYYDGPWSAATGAKTAPKIYSHNDSVWLLVTSVADITTETPSNSNTKYLLIGNAPAGEMITQTLSGTTPTWTVTDGPFAEITLSGNTTITLAGEPAGSVATPLILKVTQDGAGSGYTLGFSGATIKTEGANGLGSLSSGASDVDYIALITDDNGTSYAAKIAMRNIA